MKALVGTFNQEKALVGAFSVIVKTGCGIDGALHSSTTAAADADVFQVRTIFILGPSHHVRLSGCAVSQCSTYRTPLGDLAINRELVQELLDTGGATCCRQA